MYLFRRFIIFFSIGDIFILFTVVNLTAVITMYFTIYLIWNLYTK